MQQAKKPQQETQTTEAPQFSAITPGNLGLQAGFWSGEEGDEFTFRPIVGWVTVTNFLDQALFTNVLQPVVKKDNDGWPVPAAAMGPTYRGAFAEGATPKQARALYDSWPEPAPQATDVGRFGRGNN